MINKKGEVFLSFWVKKEAFSQVVPDSKRKTLWITSARIEKADGGSQVPNDSNAIPQPTPKAPLVSSSASTPNISQDTQGVNNYSMQGSQNDTSLVERLEAQSQNNEPIAVEDVKKATAFGEEGSKLVAELANSEGMTFSQAEKAVETAYMAGLSNVDGGKVSFETDLQIDAFTAGKKDAALNHMEAEGKVGQTLERDLIQQGVPLADRRNIIQAATEIEGTLAGTKQSISSVVSGVRKITNNIAKVISQKAGSVQNLWGLLHTNLKALQSNTVSNNRDLVSAYVETYLDAMKNNQFGRYNEISAKVQNVSGALTEYIVTGIMPEGAQTQEVFIAAAEDIVDIVRMAEEMIGNARAQLYGNKTSFTEKDVSSKENSRDIMELSAGAKVSYALNGNPKQGKRKSGQGRRSTTRNQQMRVFPPFDESHSDANERATRWAHQEDVDEGAMKIAFYHNGIYLIEKTANSDLGYEIVKKLKKKDLEMWEARQKRKGDKQDGKINAEYSRSGGVVSGNRQDREFYNEGRRTVNDDNSSDKYSGETAEVQGVDREQDGRWGTENNRSRNNQHSVEDREGKVNHSLESEVNENESGRNEDLLHDDGSKRKYSKNSGRQARKVDGRSSRYKEGREAASERRKRCKALKDAGHTRKRVILGHRCEVIPQEHYDSEMAKLVKENQKNGIDETILVVDGIKLPKVDSKGKAKTAKGMFIRTADGRKIVVVQYDHEIYSPKQINDHELVHNDYGNERTQRIKNIILKTLPVKKRNELLGIIQDDYSGVLEDLEGDALEEMIANILSGMHNLSNDFLELSKAYWNKDDALIKRWEYEVSKKSFARAVEKGYAGEMERINRQLAYDEYAQLKEYIMDMNNRPAKLKKVDCKEMGNNFYVWNNKSKTEYEVLFSIPLEGNTDIIKLTRSGIENGAIRTANSISEWSSDIRSGKRGSAVVGGRTKRTTEHRNNDRLSVRQSEGDTRGYSDESGRDTSGNRVKYALDQNGLWEMEHIFENDDPEGEIAMMQEWKDALIEKYGAIPKGENPARDIDVPRKTADDKTVSQTVRTILEAKATPDEAIPNIEKMVEDGIFSYDVYTDKKAINNAESYIKEYGWDESLDDWFNDLEKGIVSKQHTAMGWALYNNAANIAATTTSETERTSAIKTSLKILDAMIRHQRSAAQINKKGEVFLSFCFIYFL